MNIKCYKLYKIHMYPLKQVFLNIKITDHTRLREVSCRNGTSAEFVFCVKCRPIAVQLFLQMWLNLNRCGVVK